MIDENLSVIAYYFPILECFAFFYKLRRELVVVLLNLAVTVTCIVLCFALPSYVFGRVDGEAATLLVISEVNYIFSFIAFIFYIYYTTKDKLQSEALPIQSRETAERMAGGAERLAQSAEQMAE